MSVESEIGTTGAVDIGQGLAVVLSVGSHSPGAGEPFTEVLGELAGRGAQPLVVLDALRCGEPADSPQTRALLGATAAELDAAAAAAGVTAVHGPAYCEPSYRQAPFVTTVAVGLLPSEAAGPVGRALTLPGSAAPQPPSESLYPKGPMMIPTGWSGGGTIVKLIGAANLAARRAVFGRSGHGAPAEAAVIALPGAVARPVRGLALVLDGNGRRVAVNPHAGASEAVYANAARLAAVGADARGLAVAVHVADVEDPPIAWQLSEVIDGIAEAGRALDVPVVAVEVVQHPESADGPVLPTPVIGMVGTVPEVDRAGQIGFRARGEKIALVGVYSPLRDGAEIAKQHGHPLAGMIPFKDPVAVQHAHAIVREGVRSGRFTSAHAVTEGGLAVALAESCAVGGHGAQVQISGFMDVFGEDLGTAFLVTGEEQDLAGLTVIGEVGGDLLDIRGSLVVPVAELQVAGVLAG